ncbi:MAG TPA: SUMF1/EgtB/PvdO family nonheme iron enzyme [Gemmatimonadaceae bacterium]|nr:SUMF1/EgtB/PvdO family nonheme iron enzyme [Gemmatimonadaceae bacterium]
MTLRLLLIPGALLGGALLGADLAAPEGMVKIPGGTFAYGSDSASIPGIVARFHLGEAAIIWPEAPQYKVTVPPFWLDRTEVTLMDFGRFVVKDTLWLPGKDSTKISNGDYMKPWAATLVIPAASESLPATYVTWYAARSYCSHQGKRLPTELEWEYAARGGLTGDVFPWGDSMPDSTRANFAGAHVEHPVNVGRYPPNGYGLYDMAGNVWEFMADQFADPRPVPGKDPVVVEPWPKDPDLAARERVVIRGGSYDGAPVNLRVRYRDSHPAGGAQPFVGFRCAKKY